MDCTSKKVLRRISGLKGEALKHRIENYVVLNAAYLVGFDPEIYSKSDFS
jgi:hypothetical protein